MHINKLFKNLKYVGTDSGPYPTSYSVDRGGVFLLLL
jgi:hypothetical protein